MNISQDFISLLSIGGTDLSAPDTIRADIRDSLWWRYLESRVPVQMKAGVRRFMVWAPGGYERGKPINFTQWFMSLELGGAANVYIKDGAEVIVYIGQMPRDPVLSKAKAAEWLHLAVQNLGYLIDSGCSIAFDNLDDGVECSDRHELFVRMLAATGVKVYVEPRIRADKPSSLRLFPGITVAADLETHPKRYALGVEHIALMTGAPPPSFGWMPGEKKTGADWNAALWGPKGWVRRQLDAGRTPCVTFNRSMLALGEAGMKKVIESTIS